VDAPTLRRPTNLSAQRAGRVEVDELESAQVEVDTSGFRCIDFAAIPREEIELREVELAAQPDSG
jgi:hypothetical protein